MYKCRLLPLGGGLGRPRTPTIVRFMMHHAVATLQEDEAAKALELLLQAGPTHFTDATTGAEALTLLARLSQKGVPVQAPQWAVSVAGDTGGWPLTEPELLLRAAATLRPETSAAARAYGDWCYGQVVSVIKNGILQWTGMHVYVFEKGGGGFIGSVPCCGAPDGMGE